MLVFILIDTDYEESRVIGVYSTKEKAVKAMIEYYRKHGCGHFGFSITAVNLDYSFIDEDIRDIEKIISKYNYFRCMKFDEMLARYGLYEYVWKRKEEFYKDGSIGMAKVPIHKCLYKSERDKRKKEEFNK